MGRSCLLRADVIGNSREPVPPASTIPRRCMHFPSSTELKRRGRKVLSIVDAAGDVIVEVVLDHLAGRVAHESRLLRQLVFSEEGDSALAEFIAHDGGQ